ncbi:MAG: nucleoside hydrolase [Steroidobacteraceae bacterium]
MKMRFSFILRTIALSAVILAAQLTGCAFATAHAGTARPKVIFDEDEMGPGGTNIQATLMLAQDKSIDLLGITVPTGDGWRNEEVAHVLRALQIAHRGSIPVYPGAEFPLLNTVQRTRAWEKMYGKLFYDGAFMSHWPSEGTRDWTPLHPNRPAWVPPLPEGEPTIHARKENAALFMIRMVHKYPHQVTILAAGPLTDIALAASLDPRFASLAKQLVFMGGSFNPQYADTPFAHPGDYLNAPRQEFNVGFDPEAAAIVLQQHWHKITEVPVDATQSTTLMSRRMLRAVAHGKAPFDHYLGRFGQVYPLWDETTVALWLDPALITREKTLLVEVDTNFTANYGTIESWPLGAGPDWGEQPVHVVFGVDAPKIDRLVVRLLSAAKPIALHFPRHRAH